MSSEELADIFNAFLLCRKSNEQPFVLADSCSYMQYLGPVDRLCRQDPDEKCWSMDKVRQQVSGIAPVTDISKAFRTWTSNEANTATVYVVGNHGTYAFSGRHFRDIFPLRAKGLWSPTYRFDIGYCASSGCTNPDYFR